MGKPSSIEKNKHLICKCFTVLQNSTFKKLKAAERRAKIYKNPLSNICLFFEEKFCVDKYIMQVYIRQLSRDAYLLSIRSLNVKQLCFTVLILIL